MLRAYYLVRQALLAYDHAELREPLLSVLKDMPEIMCMANNWMQFFMRSAVSRKLQHSHKMFEPNPDAWEGTYRDPNQFPIRVTARWRAAGVVLAGAVAPKGEPPGFDYVYSDSDAD